MTLIFWDEGNKQGGEMKEGLIVIFLVGFLYSSALISAEVQEVDYLGWRCLKMANSNTEVYLAPEIGGRIIQYVYLGHPFLWVNKKLMGKVYPIIENNCFENWKSYGGDKVWPAPQGWDGAHQWPGPGDEVMDAPYKAEIIKRSGDYVQVRMISSGKGGYAGVQFITELSLFDESSRVYFKTTMKNVSKKETEWGIWRVSQMDFSGPAPKTYNDRAYLVIPLNPNSIWPERFKVMFGLAESWNWNPDYNKNQMIVKYMNLVGKIGLDPYNGWAGFVDEASGFSYVQRYETFPGAKYPDNSTFYVWVAGRGEFIHKHKLLTAEDDPEMRFIEMEILSPQIKLKPGESHSLYSSWEAVRGNLNMLRDLEMGYIPPPNIKR